MNESRHKDLEVVFSDPSRAEEASELFRKNGFVVLRNAVPAALISELRQDLIKAVADGAIINAKRDIHLFPDGEISSAHNLIDYLPRYQELQNLPNIRELTRAIFEDVSAEKFNSSYFAKPKVRGLETRPHQDNAFFCMEPADVLTCWMPVTFATRENGCLYYYAGSQQAGNLEHQPEGNLGASMCVAEAVLAEVQAHYPKRYIELERGDCVVHGAQVVHGSEANTSAHDRNAFNFSVASKYAQRRPKMFADYQQKLERFLERKKSMGQI